MFNFTPLLGAQSISSASQSLLELDGGIKILVDVGWDSAFDGAKLRELEKHVSSLSIVLLTHATVEHIGAYAHCCKHVAGFSRIPVYATTPVVNMGRMVVGDMYASSIMAASLLPKDAMLFSPVASTSSEQPDILLQSPTAEEIAIYFAAINPLKYSQSHQPLPSPFSPPLTGLTVTAYSAGHTLGGTIWHIQHGLESIVYASDWSLGKENLLPGAAWLGAGGDVLEPLYRPTALICSSRGVERPEALARKERDSRMVSLIRETIAQGGKVLVPTDSAARVLELAFILNSTWKENMDGPHADTYKNTRIYMATRNSPATMRYLQSMLEWMDDSVVRNAEAVMAQGGQGNSALDWDHVKHLEKKSQVERALAARRPCVMLASDASMEWGFSRQALQSLADDPRNLVVMTETVAQLENQTSGVGRQLWDFYQSQQGQQSAQSGARVVNAEGVKVEITTIRTEPLKGGEDGLYQQYLARQRLMHSSLLGDNAANDSTTNELADDQASESSESSDEDEDAEHQGRALNLSTQLTQNKRKIGVLTDAELGVNVLLRGKNVHDYDVRNKRGREKMFPFAAHKNKDDEFGDLIKPEDYLRAEERDDGGAIDVPSGDPAGKQEAAMGQKRKWDESASKGRRGSKPQNKRARLESTKQDRAPDDIDAIIARATGSSRDANGDVDGGSGESDESEYEPDEATEDGPRKAVFGSQTLTLNLKVAYVDFSGLYRLNDLQGLIGRINPRKLIVTAGNASETKLLAETCRTAEDGKAVQGEIFTPSVGEVVDASVDTNAWTLKLSRGLIRRLKWKELGTDKPSIAAVYGVLGNALIDRSRDADDESAKKKPKLAITAPEKAPQAKAMPILDLLNNAQYGGQQERATQPVHVGDLRLADIRQAVQKGGHTAEFRGGGTLLIDGTVVVRKSQTTGGIEVEAGNQGLSMPGWRTMKAEGMLETEGTFFAVKRAIYERLAVVAGA